MSTQLPVEFLAMLKATGCEALGALGDVLLSTSPAVAVRLNSAKGIVRSNSASGVEWCNSGYYLDERPQFIFDPALHQGRYYVQDASSMAHGVAVARACELVGGLNRPLRYLDACAAPGGKTTGAIDRLPDDAFVVANEFDSRRTSILIENLAKWGYEGVVVTREDCTKSAVISEFFDIIAADVPCSGEGMMRKDAQAVEQWSLALVAECAERQRLIVDNLWQSLRPGGCFIYSTCTFNLDENERIVRHMIDELGAEVVDVPDLNRPEIVGAIGESFPCYRFIPGKVRGEGQFIALLRKPGNAEPPKIKTSKNRATERREQLPSDVKNLLYGEWIYSSEGESVRAIRSAHAELIDAVSRHWYAIVRGLETGTVKGRDFIPSQSLAMARSLRADAYPRFEVDRPTAIEYLRRNVVTIEAPRGIVLLCYDGHPLGFVKNLGNRANNLYPMAWRILNTH